MVMATEMARCSMCEWATGNRCPDCDRPVCLTCSVKHVEHECKARQARERAMDDEAKECRWCTAVYWTDGDPPEDGMVLVEAATLSRLVADRDKAEASETSIRKRHADLDDLYNEERARRQTAEARAKKAEDSLDDRTLEAMRWEERCNEARKLIAELRAEAPSDQSAVIDPDIVLTECWCDGADVGHHLTMACSEMTEEERARAAAASVDDGERYMAETMERCYPDAAARPVLSYGVQAAAPQGAGPEDRSEPPPGYEVLTRANSDGERYEAWTPRALLPMRLVLREKAVAACWAHRDAVAAATPRAPHGRPGAPGVGYLDGIESDEDLDDTGKWRAFANAWGIERRRCSDLRESFDRMLRALAASTPHGEPYGLFQAPNGRWAF